MTTPDDTPPKKTKPDPGRDGDYTVGYRKPPLHSRFKKGASGNPRERQKDTEPRNILKAVRQVFLREIPIREGDQTREVPKVIALVESALADALRGDAGSQDAALDVAMDIEQLLYEATTLLNAASLINRIRQSQ